MWTVTKCYAVRKEAEPYTLPVKVETAHGRKRLLVLTPYFAPEGTAHEPIELLRGYLMLLPDEVKRARAAEMQEAA